MSKIEIAFVTDRDDNGKLLDRPVVVAGDRLYRLELAPHLTLLSNDGETRYVEEEPSG